MAAKILVVDDDPNVQRLLQYTLKQEGYDVVIAADGAEGFRLWGAEAPDLILLDVMLPKLDGYQVAAKIRSEEGGSSHVPIIMLTAEREVEQKVRGLRAGADDYLIKPFHPAELLARIKSLLARFAPRDVLLARPPMGRVLAYYGAKGGVGTTTQNILPWASAGGGLVTYGANGLRPLAVSEYDSAPALPRTAASAS